VLRAAGEHPGNDRADVVLGAELDEDDEGVVGHDAGLEGDGAAPRGAAAQGDVAQRAAGGRTVLRLRLEQLLQVSLHRGELLLGARRPRDVAVPDERLEDGRIVGRHVRRRGRGERRQGQEDHEQADDGRPRQDPAHWSPLVVGGRESCIGRGASRLKLGGGRRAAPSRL
jgi:hypothetical protein